MNAPASNSRPPLWRDVLVIVLAGCALGAGYNQVQLRSGEEGKGLAWVKVEAKKLASLESVLADAGAPSAQAAEVPPAAVTPAATSTPVTPPPATELSAGKKPAARDSTKHAGAPPTKGGKSAPAPAASTPASTLPAAAPAPAASTPAPAADVPAIPDTREPLEVQYPIVKKLHAAGAAVFVDARSAEEYAEAHIPGAVNLPFDDVFKKPALAKQLDDGGKPVVCYCGGGDCELSKSLAFALIEAGHRKVLVFMGGLPGWKDPGNPVVTGPAPGAGQ